MTFTSQPLADTLEQELRAYRPITLKPAWAVDTVFPAYAGLSLRNVPHSIAALLNAPMPNSAPLDERIWSGQVLPGSVDRVIAFLFDGVGYMHLNLLMEQDAEIRSLVSDLTDGRGALPLTSVLPSTTAVALTTLWTGAAPGTHGITGTYTYLRDYSVIGDMLKFAPATGKTAPDELLRWGLQPDTFVPVPGISEHLSQAGIAAHLLVDHSLVETGLSQILHRGISKLHRHLGYSDMLLRLNDVLRATRGERAYVGIYHPGMDTLAHAYGAHTPYTHAEIKHILRGVRDAIHHPDVQDGRTLFMLLADHGHYDATQFIDLKNDPRAAPIRDALLMSITADERLPNVYLRSGTQAQVEATIDADFADTMTYIRTEDALAAGLYGTDWLTEMRTRVGDLILVPRLGYKVVDAIMPPHRLVSVHAGLDAWEMLIPLLWKML